MAARARYCPVLESFWVALSNEIYSDAQRYRMYESMFRYTFAGEFPDFSDDPMLGVVWELIRPNIDATVKRSEANRRNAEKSRAKDVE